MSHAGNHQKTLGLQHATPAEGRNADGDSYCLGLAIVAADLELSEMELDAAPLVRLGPGGDFGRDLVAPGFRGRLEEPATVDIAVEVPRHANALGAVVLLGVGLLAGIGLGLLL